MAQATTRSALDKLQAQRKSPHAWRLGRRMGVGKAGAQMRSGICV